MSFQLSVDVNYEKNRTIRVGVYASLIAFLGAAGYSIAQLLQIGGMLKFPLDAALIYYSN